MMKVIYKIYMTFTSLMFLLCIYAVKEHLWIPEMGIYTIILYIGAPFLLSGLGLWIANYLSHDAIESESEEVEMANDTYMPVYLGYFFVALSIPEKDYITLGMVFGLIFILTLFSQTQYFNPVFLMYGYKFYHITKKNHFKVFIITRKKIRNTEDLVFLDLRRINDFTFIDKEK